MLLPILRRKAFTNPLPRCRRTQTHLTTQTSLPRQPPPIPHSQSHTNSTPNPNPSTSRPLSTILGTATLTLFLTQLYTSKFTFLPQLHAESAASTPSKKLDNEIQKDDLSREKGLNYEYADDEVVDKVIGLLREKLGEDKVTTGDDERLGHGLSPNTYHSLFFSLILIFLFTL
jgi:hypothetical protein